MTPRDLLLPSTSSEMSWARSARSGAPSASSRRRSHRGRRPTRRVPDRGPRTPRQELVCSSEFACRDVRRRRHRIRSDGIAWGWRPLLTGVAFVDAVLEVTGIQAGLKWPNDVTCSRTAQTRRHPG
jgi:hypothetical protein